MFLFRNPTIKNISYLILSYLDNLRLNSYILDAAFSYYGNGLGLKQTCTSEYGIWKTHDF